MSEPKKPKRYPVLDPPLAAPPITDIPQPPVPKTPRRYPVLDEPSPIIDFSNFGGDLPRMEVDPDRPLAQVIPFPVEARPRTLGGLFEGESPDAIEAELDERVNATIHDPDQTWEEYTEQLLKSSCAFFAQEILTGPPESPYNGRFLVAEHHEIWDDLIANHRRICVLAPRDHGKTFYFDFAYPIWQAWRKPGGCGFIFSATAPQAERILEDIKTEIESNPKLDWLVPKKKSRWGVKYIRLSNGHKIYARGFLSKVRGAHPDWIVVDDALNDETIYSELVRQKQIEYFYTAIVNMVVPGGQIIVVGTPFHAADLYGSLAVNPEYVFRKFQAIRADGTPLWPERYSLERLQAKKREIGSIRFTREFMADPIADDMSLFPYKLFRGDPTEQMMLKLGMPAEFWHSMGVQVFQGVDFAISSSVEADYFIIWTVGVDKYQNRWIIDIERERGLAYQEQLSRINASARKYEPSLIFLESNQMQQIFGDELIRLTDLPIKEFVTGVQKNSIEKGVPSLRVLFENGKYRIPRGDAHSVELTDTWIEEMRSFTFHEGKLQSVGKHDDTVMGCWICDQAIRHGAFTFSFDGDTNVDMKKLMEELTGEAAEGEGAPDTAGKVERPSLTEEDLESLPLGRIPVGDPFRMFG